MLEYDTPLTSDATADLVFGQLGSFITGVCNRGGIGAATVCSPSGLAVDSAGNLFLADTANSRVLRYNNPPVTRSTSADLVLGQSDFTSNTCNPGGSVTAAGLCQPTDVAAGLSGNVFVADAGNSRVLEYNAPLTSAQAANVVFGQAGLFTSSQCPRKLSGATLCGAVGVALDAAGDLFASDTGNSRVLEFKPPFPAIPTAVREAGQPDFTHGIPNRVDARGLAAASSVALDQSVTPPHLYIADTPNNRIFAWANIASAFGHSPADLVIGQADSVSTLCGSGATLCNPEAVAVDPAGTLWVADTLNNRVLGYISPFTTDITADIVLGGGSCVGSPGPQNMCRPAGVATDASGNLFVSDMSDQRVLEFNATGHQWHAGRFDHRRQMPRTSH